MTVPQQSPPPSFPDSPVEHSKMKVDRVPLSFSACDPPFSLSSNCLKFGTLSFLHRKQFRPLYRKSLSGFTAHLFFLSEEKVLLSFFADLLKVAQICLL